MGASSAPRNRSEAQRRADRVRAFREELAAARVDGALILTPEQDATLAAYHDRVLGELSRAFDVDVSEQQKKVSLGMQVAALVGGFALAASVMLLFFRIWGLIPVAAQVGLLVAAPVAMLAATDWTSYRGGLRFTTMVLAGVSFAAFLLTLQGLGQVFAITPTAAIFPALALLAFVLAYGYDLGLLLVAALCCLLLWLATVPVRLAGGWWGGFTDHAENFLFAGAVLFALSFLRQPRYPDFPPIFRAVGLLPVYGAMLLVSYQGSTSRLAWGADTIEGFYQVASFVVAGAMCALAIWRRWLETVYLSAGAFIVYLVAKYSDWWWDVLPRWLFFLLLGLFALALLWVFRRLRLRMAGAR
jgi:hypothetical protein